MYICIAFHCLRFIVFVYGNTKLIKNKKKYCKKIKNELKIHGLHITLFLPIPNTQPLSSTHTCIQIL